jgi:hypothetical protein
VPDVQAECCASSGSGPACSPTEHYRSLSDWGDEYVSFDVSRCARLRFRLRLRLHHPPQPFAQVAGWDLPVPESKPNPNPDPGRCSKKTGLEGEINRDVGRTFPVQVSFPVQVRAAQGAARTNAAAPAVTCAGAVAPLLRRAVETAEQTHRASRTCRPPFNH